MAPKATGLLTRSPEKALVISRRLVQTAKQRARKPFCPEYFEKRDQDVDPDAPAQDKTVIRPPSLPAEQSQVSNQRMLKPPNLRDVDLRAVAYYEPSLQNVSLDYLRRALVSMGPRMLGAYRQFRADPPSAALPADMNVLVTDFGLTCLPTHVLAVYSPADPQNLPVSASGRAGQMVYQGRPVTLFPVHAIVFIAHCGNLPRFPLIRPQLAPVDPGSPVRPAATAYRLPVVPFRVPMDYAFEPILYYLYTLDKESFLNTLISDPRQPRDYKVNAPYPSISPLRVEKSPEQSLPEVVDRILSLTNRDPDGIRRNMQMIGGVWRNAIGMSICDDNLWETVSLAWDACLAAMKILETEWKMKQGSEGATMSA